jgi:hypothetical protein
MDTDRRPNPAQQYRQRKKERRATEEEMEGPTAYGGLRNRLTRLNLHAHDDDSYYFFLGGGG